MFGPCLTLSLSLAGGDFNLIDHARGSLGASQVLSHIPTMDDLCSRYDVADTRSTERLCTGRIPIGGHFRFVFRVPSTVQLQTANR